MNLQVYTDEPQVDGKKMDLTLFHLRMHDLKNRQFSLRRYCRDSGREVCHSSRKYTKPAAVRPGLQRSMSNALNSLRSKSDSHSNPISSIKRVDSGYGSLSEEDVDLEEEVQSPKPRSSIPMPTNTTHLEFSNYSHVDVKRRGAKSSKRYEFEYWGEEYTWKRVCRRSGSTKEISYHLIKVGTTVTIAHIAPIMLTPAETEDEEAKGGWIPPCTLRISDQKISSRKMTDLAEYVSPFHHIDKSYLISSSIIVSTGLITLVDDCIKSRWHQKRRVQMKLPSLLKSPLKMNMEYVGPKRLVDEVFNRRGTTATRRPTPLRQISAGL